MQEQPFWSSWVQFLQKLGLNEPAAALLEGAGPFKLLAAQLLYFSQPFFDKALPTGQWEALAHMLEHQEESLAFAARLHREGSE